MGRGPHRYRTLLSAPGVRTLFVSSFVGRLPVGMAIVLVVFVVHAGTASYTIAGLAASANTGAAALCGPVLGRLADRGHAALILVLTGFAQCAALTGLVGALRAH